MYQPPLPDVPEVTPRQAEEMAAAGAWLIDIREPDEWEQARIPGARHKPLSQIQAWWQELPDDVDIVLQCRTGSRSAYATEALITQAGFDRVFNLAGGLVAWHTEGLPISRDPVD
jgi:rhodanese-related sulfurtransferase